jgi:hypothetical protein
MCHAHFYVAVFRLSGLINAAVDSRLQTLKLQTLKLETLMFAGCPVQAPLGRGF